MKIVAFVVFLQRNMLEKSEFDSIFREYYSPLYFFARQYVDDEEACRDIVSGAFERLWRNFSKVERENAKSFLYIAVRNLCVDHARQASRHRAYARYVAAMSHYATDASSLLEREELQERVNRKIGELKPPTRDIFMACYVERKKYKEVAEQMGISTATVKKHIVKALKMMRQGRRE